MKKYIFYIALILVSQSLMAMDALKVKQGQVAEMISAQQQKALKLASDETTAKLEKQDEASSDNAALKKERADWNRAKLKQVKSVSPNEEFLQSKRETIQANERLAALYKVLEKINEINKSIALIVASKDATKKDGNLSNRKKEETLKLLRQGEEQLQERRKIFYDSIKDDSILNTPEGAVLKQKLYDAANKK